MAMTAVAILRISFALALGLASAGAPASATDDPLWLRRAGTEEEDAAWRVATDGVGNAIVAGWTTGALFGGHRGSDDVWLAKYGSAGRRLWARQFGSVDTDNAAGVATDAAGSIYLAGWTSGDLFAPNRGGDLDDAWVAKFGPDGVRRWGRQFGTADADGATGIAVDSQGRIFVAGSTGGSLAGASRGESDAWLARLDAAGHFVWRRQLGSDAEDGIGALATTRQGDIVVAGTTWGSLAGPNRGLSDAWIGKYGPDGRLLWTKQIGTDYWDFAESIATDRAGNILVAGYSDRPWLAKYDSAGRLRWRRLLGPSSANAARTIATDGSGAVYLATYVGREPGVVKYDRSGQLVASRQIVAAVDDIAFAVALDRRRNVFLVGGLALSPDGYRDAWVAKFAPM